MVQTPDPIHPDSTPITLTQRHEDMATISGQLDVEIDMLVGRLAAARDALAQNGALALLEIPPPLALVLHDDLWGQTADINQCHLSTKNDNGAMCRKQLHWMLLCAPVGCAFEISFGPLPDYVECSRLSAQTRFRKTTFEKSTFLLFFDLNTHSDCNQQMVT